MRFCVFLSTLLSATALALPTEKSAVVHEKRYTHPGLRRGARVDGTSITKFRIALKQRNIENRYDYLMSISHPSSPKYGRLWTTEEVRGAFAPSGESVEAVRTWLSNAGIQDVEERRGWLEIQSTVGHVEKLMQSEYYEHEDHETGAIRMGCDEYSLPENVADHVDYITPGVALSAPLEKKVEKRGWGRHNHHPGWPSTFPHPGRPWSRHTSHSEPAGASSLPKNLRNCGDKITPDCLRALYDLPSHEEVANSYDSDATDAIGVFETGSIYIPKDLDRFFKKYAPYIPDGTRPTGDAIDGAVLSVNSTTKFLAGEANIDLDIIYSLTYPQKITVYQSLPVHDGQYARQGFGLDYSIGNYLDAIDSSYCSDEDKAQGLDCGTYSPTRVTSFSYGASEIYYPIKQQERQCNEFMKLGLQGHTFTISSGDYGVADRPSYEYDTDGCIIAGNYNATIPIAGPKLNGSVFSPNYPQNCPYVLSVGGTQLNPEDTVDDPESVLYVPELTSVNFTGIPNIPATFSSSGGFSNYFSRPDYQKSAVDSYFAKHDPGYPYYNFNGLEFKNPGNNIGENGGKYNRIGRAFPDVSANGAKFQYYLNGDLQPNWGTSLSAPIWASVITLINEKRAEHGKGPVGFVNPVLYEHPEAFHDITKGHNPGCFTRGFDAVEGWDPATGLGTPDFPKLLEVFLALP